MPASEETPPAKPAVRAAGHSWFSAEPRSLGLGRGARASLGPRALAPGPGPLARARGCGGPGPVPGPRPGGPGGPAPRRAPRPGGPSAPAGPAPWRAWRPGGPSAPAGPAPQRAQRPGGPRAPVGPAPRRAQRPGGPSAPEGPAPRRAPRPRVAATITTVLLSADRPPNESRSRDSWDAHRSPHIRMQVAKHFGASGSPRSLHSTSEAHRAVRRRRRWPNIEGGGAVSAGCVWKAQAYYNAKAAGALRATDSLTRSARSAGSGCLRAYAHLRGVAGAGLAEFAQPS